MKGIDFWRFADELSVLQATLLIIGVDPSGLEYEIERKSTKPRGYEAIKHSLITSIRRGDLEGREIRHPDPRHGDEYVDINETLLTVESLKDWIRKKGVRTHFFFFPEEPEGEYLSPANRRYSPKLAAAVRAWEALEDESLHAKTPKQSVIKWLRMHGADFDLTDDDGKPIESAIEEIAKIVNWSPKGGAPLTPSGAGSIKPTAGSTGNPTGSSLLAVTKEQKLCDYGGMTLDLDSEIPF